MDLKGKCVAGSLRFFPTLASTFWVNDYLFCRLLLEQLLIFHLERPVTSSYHFPPPSCPSWTYPDSVFRCIQDWALPATCSVTNIFWESSVFHRRTCSSQRSLRWRSIVGSNIDGSPHLDNTTVFDVLLLYIVSQAAFSESVYEKHLI